MHRATKISKFRLAEGAGRQGERGGGEGKTAWRGQEKLQLALIKMSLSLNKTSNLVQCSSSYALQWGCGGRHALEDVLWNGMWLQRGLQLQLPSSRLNS